MMKTGAVALVALTVAVPSLAQTTTTPATRSPAATSAPATHDTAGNPTSNGYNTPSARNPIMTDSGGMRASRVIGSSVYNDRDQKIGTVNDLVVGADKSLHAILSVGGFLGVGRKMVDVPYEKLQFGNTKGSSDNRVVMPGVSKESLGQMPDFHYTRQS